MRVIQTTACAVIVFFSSFALAEPTPPEQQHIKEVFQSLNWVQGPQKVTAGNASFNVADGYVFLNPGDTKRFMELLHNLSNGKEYFFAPKDMHWFAVFEFEDIGYVKDDEKIDAAALLESIKTGTEEANKEKKARGWPTMTIAGWKYPPYYDTQTKQLEWAIDGRDEKNNQVINFNTRLLGRHGVTSVTLVVGPDKLDVAVGEFKAALKGYEFNSGERYQEFAPGDKVAEYGLAALVAGGAAAALVKTGAAKWLGKALLAGGIAVLAGLKALFKRKKA